MNATWAMISYDCLNFLLTGFDPWILVGAFQDVAPPKPKPPLSHRIMWNTKGTGKFSQWDGVFNLWIDLFRNQAMRSHFRTLVETLQSGQSFCFYLVFVDVFSLHPRQHCQERKAGVARRSPKLVNGEERALDTDRWRGKIQKICEEDKKIGKAGIEKIEFYCRYIVIYCDTLKFVSRFLL